MALITCPECGKKKVSDTAEACPRCGFGIKTYFENQSQNEKRKQDDSVIENASEIDINQIEEDVIKPEQKASDSVNVTSKTDKNNSGKTLSIFLIFFIVLAVVIVLFVLFHKSNLNNDDEITNLSVETTETLTEMESLVYLEQSGEDESEVSSEENDPAKESNYIEAKALLEDGRYEEAEEIFAQLDSYKDSKNLFRECNYQEAETLFISREFQEAKELYLKIERYKDSHEKILECTYNIAYSYYQEGDYFAAAELLYEPGTGQLLHKESDVLRKRMVEENRNWFLQRAKEEFTNGNFDNADKCYHYIGGEYQLSDKEKVDYYLNTFMRMIQGEYTADKCPGVTGVVNGFYFSRGDVEYKITPVHRDSRGITETVGLLNGQDEHFLKSSEEGHMVERSDNEDERAAWYTEEGNANLEERKARRESEEKAKSEKEKEEDEKREAEKRKNAKKEPYIGMTADEVRNSSWGEPKKINKTTYEWGTTEQWVYSMDRYIYLENGRVTAIQE